MKRGGGEHEEGRGEGTTSPIDAGAGADADADCVGVEGFSGLSAFDAGPDSDSGKDGASTLVTTNVV